MQEPARPKPETSGDIRPPEVTIPADAIIVMPMRNVVLFPGIVAPLGVGRATSVAAAQEAARNQRPIGLLLQRDPEAEEPDASGLHQIGTVANILRYVTDRNGVHNLIVHGEGRFRVVEFLPGYPFLVARIERIAEPEGSGTEIEAQLHRLKARALEGVQLLPDASPELAGTIEGVTSAGQLADFVAGFMDGKPTEKQDILETIELLPRLQKVQWLVAHRLEVLRLSRDIGEQTRESMAGRQREYVLREQLKAIQKELGESDEGGAEIEELEKAIAQAGMPEEVEKHAKKELSRLRGMQSGAAEHSMVRTYLDCLVELPWSKTSATAVDIAEARRILDEDHYGLPKIKRRILEFLAVRKLNPAGRSPILCFVGPPGVGKTSLGQSIARATGRKFARVSLGGTHDEAEIRGHRRTYVGAMPGNIIQAIRKAGTRDCVLMLDEMDKLGAGGFHGDPSSALLEVLDPEQNASFRDNYLAVPFDLSQVIFIATANVLDTIPGPLLDRMEVIQLSGYTEQEKLAIAQRYLIKRQLEANGLKAEQCSIAESALRELIHSYTRESGVRNLERQIGSVFRHAAMRIAEGAAQEITINDSDLPAILGAHRYESDLALRTGLPGVSTGLAWTPVGGDILFIEASRVPGSGRLMITGQLGEVMKESVQAALTLVKGNLRALGVSDDINLDKLDIHLHVPAGAVPKDGPSAGVAIYVALASLLAGRPVRSDTAMTGEISLRGLVLPVGGIKEKVVAAARAGIKTVMLPARNKADLEEIPEDVQRQLRFVWLERVDQAVAEAIEGSDART
ncbi:endopeptidase La [Nevskia soli]|uniref:endopeptidase La n=1 Tax=Nevskia soli TaxID=418856 RepID=UPI00068EF926